MDRESGEEKTHVFFPSLSFEKLSSLTDVLPLEAIKEKGLDFLLKKEVEGKGKGKDKEEVKVDKKEKKKGSDTEESEEEEIKEEKRKKKKILKKKKNKKKYVRDLQSFGKEKALTLIVRIIP